MNERMPELFTLLLAAGVFLAWRWWTVRRVGQLRKSLAQAQAGSQKYSTVIHLSEDTISCERPDGTIEQVTWGDLQRVDIRTTADGPLLPDQFWVLVGSQSIFVIPWESTGAEEMLARLQQLPDFNHEAVIEAASTTCAAVRTCWQKAPRQ